MSIINSQFGEEYHQFAEKYYPEEEFEYSCDEEDSGDLLSCRRFMIKFGKFKGLSVADIAAKQKGRQALRYYLTWNELRIDARKAITTVLTDYDLQKKKTMEKKNVSLVDKPCSAESNSTLKNTV